MSQSQPMLILDNGSSSIKVGYSNSSIQYNIPTVVGRRQQSQYLIGWENESQEQIYFGDQAITQKCLVQLTYPINSGVITEKEEMITFWQNIFQSKFANNDSYPLFILDTIISSKQREFLVETIFEQFSFGEISINNTSVMSLFNSGRITGAVLESGEGVSSSISIYDGYPQKISILQSSLAGLLCTKTLQNQLLQIGCILNSVNDRQILTNMKEKHCRLSIKQQDIEQNIKTSSQYCQLPDGSQLKLTNEMLYSPNVMFNPKEYGVQTLTLQQQLNNTIKNSDITLQEKLYENIIISGGNTLFNNFQDKLKQELELLEGNHHIAIISEKNRKDQAFQGAKKICQLSVLRNNFIRKSEYEEYGKCIVHKKCLL